MDNEFEYVVHDILSGDEVARFALQSSAQARCDLMGGIKSCYAVCRVEKRNADGPGWSLFD